MFRYSLQEIASITKSELIGTSHAIISQIILDSRTFRVNHESIFLAISGKQHNGHKFISEMYNKGCRNFWVQQNETYTQYPDANYIISESVIQDFQSIINHYRTQFTFPIIGITGSNGKTIVKEWLYHVLKQSNAVVRSPKSYNSQIGVPLSLMLLDNQYQIAIIEAGISLCNEMGNLEKMIHPSIGIFTNIGDAHQENFETLQQKVSEKMQLFTHCKQLIYCADYTEIDNEARKLTNTELIGWSCTKNSNLYVSHSKIAYNKTKISITWDFKTLEFTIPFIDSASIENAVHCFIAYSLIQKQNLNLEQFEDLPQVAMRLEQKAGKNNCTIINDSYNADYHSVQIALQYLSQQKQHSNKTLIISDIKQTGIPLENLYSNIYNLIQEYGISRIIGVGPNISKYLQPLLPNGIFFNTTNDLLLHYSELNFNNETILLKAAREFEFELLAKKLEFQTHQTVLEINLNAIVHNLNYFKTFLKPETKIMVMVKAFSYGSGSYEIANILQHNRVDYLAVAFVDEGIELRNAGISLPIVVMNPEYGVLNQLFEYNLEPNIHNFEVLEEYTEICKSFPNKTFSIHIKLDTGMARYGFSQNDVPRLVSKIKKITNCKIDSIFSHLVGSDESIFDDFTKQQLSLFTEMSSQITRECNYPILLHILNSAGIERFSDFQFNMVRLGIGLYGISVEHEKNCMHVSTLKTFISGIRTMEAGTTVGYSRKGKITKASRIGVLPIGYADGYNRKLSNGVGSVLVNNQEVPIIGNVCMDATMIDITNISAEIGDEVILFGTDLPITQIAKKLETIPYEVITSISRRVKRIYYFE